MRSVSLISIYDVLTSESEDLIKAFLSAYGIKLKKHERSGVVALIDNLKNAGLINTQTSGFFMSVETQRGIDEEFDILRYTDNSVLNIEIKSSVPENGFLQQMLRHHRVLSLLEKKVLCYTYIEDTNVLYFLSGDKPIEISFDELLSSIPIEYIDENEIDRLDISSLLVSPYSQPKEFSSHKYYLTVQQDQIKRSILKHSNRFVAIEGKAGSGKSLLLWDLANCYKEQGENICIIFCANLGDVHYIKSCTGMNLIQIKDFNWDEISNYDIILFDEAQRLYDNQYEFIVSDNSNCRFIFSVDPQQTLSEEEISRDIVGKLRSLDNCDFKKLPSSIRLNDKIESFSKRLLHYNCKDWKPKNYDCVKVTHFSSQDHAISYCNALSHEHKTILELTSHTDLFTGRDNLPHQYLSSKDAHAVIGKEYDDVVVVLSKYMKYKTFNSGEILLSLDYPLYYPYDGNHGIWEIVSRAKKSLEIVVIDNETLYLMICDILNHSNDSR